jgi:hypothetical protein
MEVQDHLDHAVVDDRKTGGGTCDSVCL